MEICSWILQTPPDFCGSVWGRFTSKTLSSQTLNNQQRIGTQTATSPKDGFHPRTVLESTNRSVKDVDFLRIMRSDCTRHTISTTSRNSATTCLRIDPKVYISDPKSYTTKRQSCSCSGSTTYLPNLHLSRLTRTRPFSWPRPRHLKDHTRS